jgi:hypothetical protein|tara:strand:+ start:607 stop:1143 length:537 start_codon:yes stop_codon:yes gene_type:complete
MGHIDEMLVTKAEIASLRSPALYTKSEVITDDADAARTLTAGEAGTVFLVDDAALTITLPSVSAELIGAKYKFLLTDKEATGLVIQSQGNTHYFNGYAVCLVSAGAPEHFVPDGNSNSKVTLNGGTQGGNLTGETGNTIPHNYIECTCIGGGAGAAWFVEVYSSAAAGETQATPFADQ